jgi:dihydroorotase
MNLLLKSAHIVDIASSNNGKKQDILIENGIIRSIKNEINARKGIKVIKEEGLTVSPGWFDLQADFSDPGFEHKEDLHSGINSAAAGGFTGVALVASTNPPIHSKSEVLYIKNKIKNEIVDVYPTGALSYNIAGKDLTEMYDMHLAGAIAFSDDKHSIDNAGFLLRALLYASNFNGVVMTHCEEKNISLDGKINEGVVSTKLGLKALPSLAEEIIVNRNIFLSEYTNCPIHLTDISTKNSVDIIRNAKAKGIKVTCSATAYNICLTDDLLMSFNTNYKLNPPLRTKEDVDALCKGVADGTIDAISSDHRPQDSESKVIEFDYAQDGMIGLETMFNLVYSSNSIKLERLIECISNNPRKIVNLPPLKLEEGEVANITIFNTKKQSTFELNKSFSKSKNSPFDKKLFKSCIVGIVNNKQMRFNK